MEKTSDIVDHLFRHESGHIISRLSSKYGMLHLSEIEDAVSEALLRAMRTWPLEIPESPSAWLYSVASRIIIDVLRRKQVYYEKVIPEYKIKALDAVDDDDDDRYATIKLMLWCAHPSLSSKDQLGLIMQLVSGFSIKEISSALLVNSESLKKRLQRARSKLKSIESELILPDINEVEDRFPILRSALYLGFNEGYYSIHDKNILREDLIYESLRLCKLLCDTKHADIGISQALMSLMLYHTSRIPARRTTDNSFILFENQDRSLWDKKMIRLASNYLESGMNSDYYTPYHIEAVIAGHHTHTQNYKDTNWKTISQLYNKLYSVTPNPIVKLNLIYATLMAGDIIEADKLLLETEPEIYGPHKYLYYAVYSLKHHLNNETIKKNEYLWNAIDTAPNQATREVLRNRMDN